MEYGAIDLHLRRSQFRIGLQDGTVVKEGRCDTTRAEFTRVFGDRAPMRILLESSTESEWVAQHLESLGHEVIVADPNYAPMYGSRSRKVKTDGRDTAALFDACRLGIYRRAHRVSASQRTRRQQLRIRRHLVQMRGRGISLFRATLRQEGWRLPRGGRRRSIDASTPWRCPRRCSRSWRRCGPGCGELNRYSRRRMRSSTRWRRAMRSARRLMTAPGVGPVVALTFRRGARRSGALRGRRGAGERVSRLGAIGR